MHVSLGNPHNNRRQFVPALRASTGRPMLRALSVRESMKKLIWITVFLSSVVQAEIDKVSVYLKFEEAYMSNDAASFSPWLSENYKIRQTLHIPGVGSDTRPVSKDQLLASMALVGKPSAMPRSTPENTAIEAEADSSFCATSTTINQTVVGGKNYEEKEVREVCFEDIGGAFKATTHNIDVHYRAL